MIHAKRGAPGESTPSTTEGGLLGGNHPHHTTIAPRTQALNWRDHLAVHPAAEMFPLLSETDPAALKELAEDIRQHGQREPASYIKDSGGNRVLLDGRNRLDALEMLGSKIDINDSRMFEQLSDGIDAQAFIISKNIHRRHLSAEDKRDLIGKLLKAKPEASNRQIATQVKVDHKTVATVRKEKEATGEIPQLKKTVGADGKKRSVIQPKKSTRQLPTARSSEAMPTAAEAEESYQETLYEQACLLLESMASETRQRFFAHTGSASARIPVPQTKSVKAQDISNVAYRLIQFDIHLAQELYGFLFDDDHIQQLRGDLITGIGIETKATNESRADDGLPDYSRRGAP